MSDTDGFDKHSLMLIFNDVEEMSVYCTTGTTQICLYLKFYSPSWVRRDARECPVLNIYSLLTLLFTIAYQGGREGDKTSSDHSDQHFSTYNLSAILLLSCFRFQTLYAVMVIPFYSWSYQFWTNNFKEANCELRSWKLSWYGLKVPKCEIFLSLWF